METKAFFDAIASGDFQKVDDVLRARPELIYIQHPEREMWEDATALQAAAKSGHLAIVKLLVEKGAEVYTNPFRSYAPVVQAAWERKADVVAYFLEEIPDRADGTNGLGVTIHLAGRLGWAEIVRKHIERDPLAVHQRGWLGDTPLHWPAHNNSLEIVTMLLDAGAVIDADEINCYGGKPLHWASEHAPATVELLLSRGAAVDSRNLKAGTEFLGFTPLIMNATQRNDCAEATELLLDAGADIHAVDANGKTPLQHATERNLTRIVEVLTRRGAVR